MVKRRNTKPESLDKKLILATSFNPKDVIDMKTGLTQLLAVLDDNKAEVEDIRWLLQRGADPNQADFSGRTPVDAAIDRGWYKAADLLLEAGAKPPKYEGAEELKYDGDPDAPYRYEPKGTFYTNTADELKAETALTYLLKHSGDYRKHVYPLLANGADVNKKNNGGETPLAIVAGIRRDGSWPWVATQLIKRGAYIDPAKKDPDEVVDPKTGATRLLAVIMEGDDGYAVKRILDEGADPNKADRTGLTPVALARALGWTGVEDLLIERGADPKAQFPNPNQMIGKGKADTPMLVYAFTYQCCHSNYKLALLKAGADPDASDAEGKTAMYWAALYDRQWDFYHLQQAGGDVTKKEKEGCGPLQIAAYNNHAEMVKRILAAAPPEEVNAATTKSRQTALYLACCKKDNDKVCQLLIEHGADATAATESGNTPLHEASGSNGSLMLINMLIDHGADVNAANKDGLTPLHEAVRSGELEKVKLLLDRGASIDKADTAKDKLLFRLIGYSNDKARRGDIAKLLLEHGADPKIRREERQGYSEYSSLIYSALNCHAYDVARALFKAGADPHDTATGGKSMMHAAMQYGQVEGVKLLLEFGFDPLKRFEYTDTSNGSRGDKHHVGSAYDYAQELVRENTGQYYEKAYREILRLFDDYLIQEPAATAPPPCPARAPVP